MTKVPRSNLTTFVTEEFSAGGISVRIFLLSTAHPYMHPTSATLLLKDTHLVPLHLILNHYIIKLIRNHFSYTVVVLRLSSDPVLAKFCQHLFIVQIPGTFGFMVNYPGMRLCSEGHSETRLQPFFKIQCASSHLRVYRLENEAKEKKLQEEDNRDPDSFDLTFWERNSVGLCENSRQAGGPESSACCRNPEDEETLKRPL